MAKRGAQSDLNRDNWDDEEDTEEAGTFTTASEEDMNKRKIIKARRRLPSDANKSGGVFKNFTGFSGFSGLKSTSSTASSTSNSSAPAELKPATKTSLAGFSGFAGLSSTTSKDIWSTQEKPWAKVNGNNGIKQNDTSEKENHSDSYLENIKSLNISVLSWLQKHVNENPYVDLTPVFKDYSKHLSNIEKKATPIKESPDIKPLPSVTPPSSLSKNEPVGSKSLDFKMIETEEKPVVNEEKPFIGLAAPAPAEKPKETTEEAEPSDEPPKPKRLSTIVVTAEEGSKFSVRCKLFFNRNNAWSELGVGMLNIKDIDGKSQLFVRADTATGNILLNVFLTSTTPVNRTGKNNVMLVSLPNPPLYSKPSEGDNTKPATYLIRVKTADNADELFQIVEDLKSK
ncbi:nuclear pore complex protein Nup50 [Exaiptasia diaphana]|uniref:RanBD1 domain-containing protein n=1 Tax=Exaiptasia diaphana TaxID=2652724 RepID=A0A913WWI5_EXADI|nr:nuclear pore complex protein Nup50 [Exaiptasia diaphana]